MDDELIVTGGGVLIDSSFTCEEVEMGLTIIVKDVKPKGQRRSEIDKKLVSEGWGSTFRNHEEADKYEYIERKVKSKYGSDVSSVRGVLINRVK